MLTGTTTGTAQYSACQSLVFSYWTRQDVATVLCAWSAPTCQNISEHLFKNNENVKCNKLYYFDKVIETVPLPPLFQQGNLQSNSPNKAFEWAMLARASPPEAITEAQRSAQSRVWFRRSSDGKRHCRCATLPLITIRGCGRRWADGCGFEERLIRAVMQIVHHFCAPWWEQIVPCQFTLDARRGVAPSLRSSALKVMGMAAPPLWENSLPIWRLQSFASWVSLWLIPPSITALELAC